MAKPFLKWAGGKTQLLPEITKVIDRMRNSRNSFIYIEPFVGGGSVLFNVLENCSNIRFAIINDMNKQLIDCYKTVSDNEMYVSLKEELLYIEEKYNNLKSDEDKKIMYLRLREEYNDFILSGSSENVIHQSALFIFLNKCGFNGIYRVNKKGEFNIPWGKKKYIKLFDPDNFDKCHVLLNEKVVFMNADYSCTEIAFQLSRVENSNMIFYLDPPYRPVSQSSSFVGYTNGGFDDNEQSRLKSFCDKIDYIGGKFLLSNSKSEDFFEKLYYGYKIDVVKARRNINSVGSKRGEVDEILVYNDVFKDNSLF